MAENQKNEAALPDAHFTKRQVQDLCKQLEAAQEQLLTLPRKSPERKALAVRIKELDRQCSAGASYLRERNLASSSLRKEWAHSLFSSYSDSTNHIRFIGFIAVMAHLDALGGGQGETTKEDLQAIFKEDCGVEGDAMSEEQFETWMKLFLGQMKEQQFIHMVKELIKTNETFIADGLFDSADRTEIVDMLFAAVDFDGSGGLSLEEFTELLKNLDDQVTDEDVKASFTATGIADGEDLRKHHFYRFVHSTFGHLQDDEFFEELDDIMEQLREFKIPLTDDRRQKAELLYDTYDLDGSGFLELEEFVCLMQKLDPTMTEDAIKGSMESVGAIEDGLNKSQFYYWVNHMFNDFSDPDYADCMTELLEFASAMREEHLLKLGLALSQPQSVSYTDAVGTDSSTQFICRENASFVMGPAILVPAEAVGKDLTFQIEPRLPLGITLDEKNGNISGSAELGTSGNQTYSVVAQNKQGSATYTFYIAVKAQGRRLKQFGTVAAKMQRHATGFGKCNAAGQTVTRNIREKIDSVSTADIVGDGENKEGVNALLKKLEAERSQLTQKIQVIEVMKDREMRAAEHADCQEYLNLLHTADKTDFSSLKNSEYLHIAVDPEIERPFLIWVAKNVNVETMDMELTMMHLFYSLDKVTRKPFTCVVDLTDAESDNCVDMVWLNRVRTLTPEKNQANAMECVILGASVGTKIKVSTFRPLVTAPVWDSFSYLDSFDELCTHFEVGAEFWPSCMNPKKVQEQAATDKVAAALSSVSSVDTSVHASDGTSGVHEDGATPITNQDAQEAKPQESSFFGGIGSLAGMDESMNVFSGVALFGDKKTSRSQIQALQDQIEAKEIDMRKNRTMDISVEDVKKESEAFDDLRIALLQLQIEALTAAMEGVQDSQQVCIKHVIDALESKFVMITHSRQQQMNPIHGEQPVESLINHLSLLTTAISACQEIFDDHEMWNDDEFSKMNRLTFTRMQQGMEQEVTLLRAEVGSTIDVKQTLPEKTLPKEKSVEDAGADSAVNTDDSVIFGVATPTNTTNTAAVLPESLASSNEEELKAYREAQQSELLSLTQEIEEDPLVKRQLRAQQLANQLNQIDQVLSHKTVNRKNEGDTLDMPGLESPPDASIIQGHLDAQGKAQIQEDPELQGSSPSFLSNFKIFGSSEASKAEGAPETNAEPDQDPNSFFNSFKKMVNI